jgi:hypothetical protein
LKGAQSCFISLMLVRIAVTPLCLCLRGTTACNESEKHNTCLNKGIQKVREHVLNSEPSWKVDMIR